MTSDEFEAQRYELYEKLYYHEGARKEHLISRLNLPFLMLAAIVPAQAYLLVQSPALELRATIVFMFWLFYIVSVVATGLSVWFFWGRGKKPDGIKRYQHLKT